MDKVFIGDEGNTVEPCEKLRVTLHNETHELTYDGKSTVLETLLNAGINAPYSCMDGACMACLGKVKSGRVYMDDLCILTEDNVAERETLTCQAKPASKIVEIDYDEI